MGFVVGMFVGNLIAWASVGAALLDRRRSGVMSVDRWWMENPERWESLRRYELADAEAKR